MARLTGFYAVPGRALDWVTSDESTPPHCILLAAPESLYNAFCEMQPFFAKNEKIVEIGV